MFISGGWALNPFCNSTANASMHHHLLLSKKYLRSKSGTKQSLVLANKISFDILCSGLSV